MPTQQPSDPWIEAWLSTERFGTYLSAATIGGDLHWTEDPTMLKLFPLILKNDPLQRRLVDANEIPRSQIQRARMDASRAGNTAPVPGKVVAEVMFGFWTYLTSNAHEKTIWVPYLHTAYPIKTDRRKIHQTLYELRKFRNRVAHHEPLLVGSEFERRKIISVASRLLPKDAFVHLTQNSEVQKILGGRPS